ncbi:unnamed protein product [Blepharisma stoltei]|uniref:Peroxin-19 n=1 Tax=Blepharisma stoltei TaxID=1481888 RepID=A0AAU9JJC1_9CILI|nr:unnamed protein product [Blepharisma stoltei]
MADNPDKLLDSALDEFEEHKEEEKKEEAFEKTIKETIEGLGDLGGAGAEMPEMPEIEHIFSTLSQELDANPELKEEFEKLSDDLFGGINGSEGVLNESMVELRDKLREYIDRKRTELSAEDLSRYSAQLDLYTQICDSLANGQQDQAMELVARLSDHGELPSELMPPMPEECTIM